MANNNVNNAEVNKVLQAIAEDPKIPWQVTSAVLVPGAMCTYACGTTGDVTIVGTIFTDGHVSLRVLCW
jgi:hypothetical protein